MIGGIIVALAMWAILLPLVIWLVSWIARASIAPSAGNIIVKFAWRTPDIDHPSDECPDHQEKDG